MNWLKRVLQWAGRSEGTDSFQRITPKVAWEVLASTGYSLSSRFVYLSPSTMRCCAVGLTALYALGKETTEKIHDSDESLNTDTIAEKAGYPKLYLRGLEAGFEGWEPWTAKMESGLYREGHEDGQKLRALERGRR